MHILDQIVATKKKEVAERKAKISISDMETQNKTFFYRDCISLSKRLKQEKQSGIIAEFKRHSPSKGFINKGADVVEVTKAYVKAGVAGISVLTDMEYFKGETEDLSTAKLNNEIPILRKDFIIAEYQLMEAKCMGADVALLIAAILDQQQTYDLASAAQNLGLEVLLEVHNEQELNHVNQHVNMVGVNNRNLDTFEVDLETSIQLVNKIPSEFVKISESGISDVETIQALKKIGYDGFLIGECFMKTDDPGAACEAFVQELTKK